MSPGSEAMVYTVACPFCHTVGTGQTLFVFIGHGNQRVGDGDLCMCVTCGEWSCLEVTASGPRLRTPTPDEYDHIATDAKLKVMRSAWHQANRPEPGLLLDHWQTFHDQCVATFPLTKDMPTEHRHALAAVSFFAGAKCAVTMLSRAGHDDEAFTAAFHLLKAEVDKFFEEVMDRLLDKAKKRASH